LIDQVEALTRSLGYARQQIHARNLVIKGNQAQLVVQGMALKKETVDAKEKN
jgi:hypothetical protein